MKEALILQGWYQTPESNWYPWLQTQLEKRGYEVYLPDLPTMHTDLPKMEEQLKFINNLLKVDKNTIIFGHSLGCLLALRLAEKSQYKKMFLVAGWDFDDLSVEHRLFWENKINHRKVKKNVKEIYCISSDNDPYITEFTAEEMSKRLNAKFILIKGAGHFTGKYGVVKIPQMLKYV